VAIYLLLRLIVGAPEECLSMMEKMRPVMHEFLRITRHRHLYNKAERFLADTRFKEGVAMRALVESRPVVAYKISYERGSSSLVCCIQRRG
jgi:hypothetical protein